MPKNNNVITFGCRLNFWESNKINNLIQDDKKKDFVVFNTCSVTNEAIKNETYLHVSSIEYPFYKFAQHFTTIKINL